MPPKRIRIEHYSTDRPARSLHLRTVSPLFRFPGPPGGKEPTAGTNEVLHGLEESRLRLVESSFHPSRLPGCVEGKKDGTGTGMGDPISQWQTGVPDSFGRGEGRKMDWSRAKSILILAFFSLNVFLAYQLLEAKGEQSQTHQVSQDTRRELTELTSDKQHRHSGPTSGKYSRTSPICRPEPLKMENLHKRDPRWRKNSSGYYTLNFRDSFTTNRGLKKNLGTVYPWLGAL